MSTLNDKHVSVVGMSNSKIESLKEELESRGVKVSHIECADPNVKQTVSSGVDLVIFNHVQIDGSCEAMKDILSSSVSEPLVPVFSLVNDNADDIQKALAEGAADYITLHESVDSILHKIEAIFNEGEIFSGSRSLDISPLKADVSATGIRVFVVEDDALLRNLLSIRLDKSFFPYEFSSDGKDVLPKIEKFKPNVIILDLMLPGKSGFDVLSELKAHKVLAKVPVIIFSNRDGAEDRNKAKELGAVSFYVKAMTDLSELIETIESLTKK